MTTKVKNAILLMVAVITGSLTGYFVYKSSESLLLYLLVSLGLPLTVFLIASFFVKDDSDEENDNIVKDADTEDTEENNAN